MIAVSIPEPDHATRRLRSPLPVSILSQLRETVASYHADYLGRDWDFFHDLPIGDTRVFAVKLSRKTLWWKKYTEANQPFLPYGNVWWSQLTGNAEPDLLSARPGVFYATFKDEIHAEVETIIFDYIRCGMNYMSDEWAAWYDKHGGDLTYLIDTTVDRLLAESLV